MRQYILSGEQSRKVDFYCIQELGIPSVVLMERAALAVTRRLQSLHKENERYYILCGVGNNGADGLAVARMLDDLRYPVTVGIVGTVEQATKEFKMQLNILKKTGISIEQIEASTLSFFEYDWIVDGIFGIGLSREVGGIYKTVIEKVNASDCNVMSIDIPSGLHSDSGLPMGIAVVADETVTFGNYKLGHKLGEGRDYCGIVTVAPIGFRREAYEKLLKTNEPLRTCEPDDKATFLFPNRKQASHKGTFGKVAVIAGMGKMPGAAYFAAAAAYRCGAGLVKVITARECETVLNTKLPEALVYSGSEGEIPLEILKKLLLDCKAIVIGPGLGQEMYAEQILMQVLQFHTDYLPELPVVLDADALNLMAKNKKLLQYLNPNFIITPHLLEMARLTDENVNKIMTNALEVAEGFSKAYGCTCVLKSATTIVTGQKKYLQTYLNLTGNSGMATGGSGDVLAGMLGGFLAQRHTECTLTEIAELVVWLHGTAGEIASEKKTEYSVMATDILEAIPEAIARLTQW